MHTHLTRRTIPWAIAAALLLGAGCGVDNSSAESEGGGDVPTTEAVTGDSEYCDVAAEWAVYEKQPFDDRDPAQFRAYWEDHSAFNDAALESAPDELEEDWQLKVDAEDETIDVVLDKYDYDIPRIMEEGTPDEQAAFEAPPDAAAALERILDYESEVCGVVQPAAADVSYEGEEPGSYCELVAAQNEAAGMALASGDPAEVEAVFEELEAQSAEMVAASPPAIKDDVAAVAAWTSGRQRDVLEAFDYDFAAAMTDGTVQERLDMNHADGEIREEFARVVAYEEQVCGA